MKLWRHYLNGADAMVLIQCDHKNLEYSQTSNVHSLRLARWAETPSSHDFVIEHLEGKKILADGRKNSHDYEICYERRTARLLATFATIPVEPYNDPIQDIKRAQAINMFAANG